MRVHFCGKSLRFPSASPGLSARGRERTAPGGRTGGPASGKEPCSARPLSASVGSSSPPRPVSPEMQGELVGVGRVGVGGGRHARTLSPRLTQDPPDWGGRRQTPARCPRRAGHLEAGGVDSDHSENSLKPGSLLLRIRALGRGSEAPSDSPGSGNPKTETSVTQTPFSKPRIPLHHSWRRSEELWKEAPGFLVDGRVIYKGFSSDRNRKTTSFRD
ncbi:uncharacterized protein LOC124225099 [Equus quagga]|uniref:uncharacterized protein LOC124225099 n=1 Tax=Equus quagga TaxID=89248 RepID=UPI001EE30E93|nr:uncharacterized protein LOC124225099 [Equus quagga]